MSATLTQENRPLAVTTPLGTDALLLTGFSGSEALSRLFHFHLEVQAPNDTPVPFDQLLGQPVTVEVEMPGSASSRENKRVFNGICYRISQGQRDVDFTTYRLELVPSLWLLTRTAHSRTFQHLTVPDILKKVLAGLKADFSKLQGDYQERDYCVQYRETDFNFASRLMEEEGIFYYFDHADGSHTLVLVDSPLAVEDLPQQATLDYKGSSAPTDAEGFVYHWEKVQELRSAEYSLWDHCFEKPHDPLEANQPTQGSVPVGGVSHSLTAGNDGLVVQDFPGGYAQRFDGIDKGGGEQPAEIGKILPDGERTVALRMQEEAAQALLVRGASSYSHLLPGYKFTLATLPESLESQAHADGSYLLTGVQHSARLGGDYRSGSHALYRYHNDFTALPAALPYRPARTTPKPVVHGTQTAVVVGPAGEEIFTDKYGRVKVQFFWDREGQNNADSSCWCRVGTLWAGQQWGVLHIPRIGQEVLVAFQEGDPDLPVIVGSVYNAQMMPPYKLPDNKTQSGIKSRSTLQGGPTNFNELRFEDKKGSEEIYFHAEKDFNRVVENNDTLKVGFDKKDQGDQTVEIFNNQTVSVGAGKGSAADGSQTLTVYKDRTATLETGNETLTVKQGNRTVTVETGDDTHDVKQGNRTVQIEMGNDSLEIKMGNQTTKLDLGQSSTEAMQSIELKVGQSSVKLDQTGVTIQGMMISIQGQVQTQVKGTMTQINGDAMLQMQGGITMIN